MDKQEINTLHKAVNKYIYKHELKRAFDNLRVLVQQTQDWELIQSLNDLETSYRYMLQYFMDGIQDPQRENVYRSIQATAYELADDAAFLMLSQTVNNNFFEKVRKNRVVRLETLIDELEALHEEISLTDLLEEDENKVHKMQAYTSQQDQLLSGIFEKVWTSGRFDDADLSRCTELIKDTRLDMEDKAQLVSVLFLNLMHRFDEKKIMLLLDAYEEGEEEIQQRALIVLMLILYLFDKRVSLYTKINTRLTLLGEQERFKRNIRNIVVQFIRSKETEQITRKMNEEILPEMMKAGNIIRDKLSSDDLSETSSWEEKNPEWQEIFEESGITDKMQEFANLQMEGADVFMSTFASLKSFPFFSNLSHWFLPFNKKFAGFSANLKNSEVPDFLDLIMQSSYLCNSDKYSFCFSVMQMPEGYRNMSMSQFKMESSELQKMEKEDALFSDSKKAETVTKQYIQDLYRFFKLYPRRKEFIDIFSLPLHFHETKAFGLFLSDEETLRMIGELYFSKNFFSEAEVIFTKLVQGDSTDNELYEKIGYCRQIDSNFVGALAAYLKSDIIKPDKPWTLRRIALCYRRLKQPEKALVYYQRLEKLMPENLNVQLNLGHCYFEEKNYEEALKYYFKVEYMDEKGKKALRPIGWTSFLAGKTEQARKYYALVIQDKPTPQDFMNAGHIEWASGNRKGAMDYYEHSILHPKGNEHTFKEDFEKDLPDLIQAGVNPDEVDLLLDQLFYDLRDEI
ncbi:MAG: tetratricopeptide repeat protein [Candidatus Azobacteroides sp.]|nr:tetratricopeptide repeat protein [Candidatus Azobacteroides sp.]